MDSSRNRDQVQSYQLKSQPEHSGGLFAEAGELFFNAIQFHHTHD